MPDRFDLGKHRRTVTCASPEAQRWFDLGLNWCYGFNHEEGVGCFRRALEHDPDCAMAHWGVAYGSGPFYNLPWRHMGEAEATRQTAICHDHISRARALRGRVTDVEAALVDALATRFQAPHPVAPEEFDRWDDDYADAMRRVYKRFPDDVDVAALFAESLMTRTPWLLWDTARGVPADGADTVEAIAVLERAMEQTETAEGRQHPAILHLHIHALEMSPEPERALVSADVLGTLCPDAGHMNHMPGHIYAQCGKYLDAKAASERAIRADRLFVDYHGLHSFYTTSYCHDLHLMMHACMMLGQSVPARAAANEIKAVLTPDVLTFDDRPQMTATMDGYYSMTSHVLVRFGLWQDILDTPLPPDPDLYPVSTAMAHYARVVALAAQCRFPEADAALNAFRAARDAMPADYMFFNCLTRDILAIAEAMAEGELAYHRGAPETGLEFLRTAVQLCDGLAYSEPWPWMHPPRHALAALLSEQGQFEEAERLYREDLGLVPTVQRCCRNENNVWSLHGLAECLRRRGAKDELATIDPMLAVAAAMADVPVRASCCCRGAPPAA